MGCTTSSAYRIGGANAEAARIGGAGAEAIRIGGVKAYCYLYCEINKNAYLRIKPAEAQWIDVELAAELNVISNTVWTIT